MKHTRGILLALFGLLTVAVPALAHHSIDAEFDQSKEFTITGVLTRIDWVNPHIYYYVDVKNDSGQVETWAFQGAPPTALHRSGVKKEDWKVGETVTVTANVAKDGTKHLGFGRMIKYTDGHVVVLRAFGE